MTALRHHWLPREVWLGTEASIGLSSVWAFESEGKARRWAAEAPDSIGAVTARRIWRVAVRRDVHTYRVTKVPATTSMDLTS